MKNLKAALFLVVVSLVFAAQVFAGQVSGQTISIADVQNVIEVNGNTIVTAGEDTWIKLPKKSNLDPFSFSTVELINNEACCVDASWSNHLNIGSYGQWEAWTEYGPGGMIYSDWADIYLYEINKNKHKYRTSADKGITWISDPLSCSADFKDNTVTLSSAGAQTATVVCREYTETPTGNFLTIGDYNFPIFNTQSTDIGPIDFDITAPTMSWQLPSDTNIYACLFTVKSIINPRFDYSCSVATQGKYQ